MTTAGAARPKRETTPARVDPQHLTVPPRAITTRIDSRAAALRFQEEASMNAINREWHKANRMPARPTRADRAKWHHEHLLACGCRTPSDAEAELIAEHQAHLDAKAQGLEA